MGKLGKELKSLDIQTRKHFLLSQGYSLLGGGGGGADSENHFAFCIRMHFKRLTTTANLYQRILQ